MNALSHYTDRTVGHVHAGALGWVGFITFGSLYYLIPRFVGRLEMYSVKAISVHFWIATLGIVLYISAMWIAGVMQGLMWRAYLLAAAIAFRGESPPARAHHPSARLPDCPKREGVGECR